MSFGTGHHSLEPDSFERNFGLRVVLNAVARSNLRSVDVATLDATTFQKRIQASPRNVPPKDRSYRRVEAGRGGATEKTSLPNFARLEKHL